MLSITWDHPLIESRQSAVDPSSGARLAAARAANRRIADEAAITLGTDVLHVGDVMAGAARAAGAAHEQAGWWRQVGDAFLSGDGFHPSYLGHQLIGKLLALQLLPEHQGPRRVRPLGVRGGELPSNLATRRLPPQNAIASQPPPSDAQISLCFSGLRLAELPRVVTTPPRDLSTRSAHANSCGFTSNATRDPPTSADPACGWSLVEEGHDGRRTWGLTSWHTTVHSAIEASPLGVTLTLPLNTGRGATEVTRAAMATWVSAARLGSQPAFWVELLYMLSHGPLNGVLHLECHPVSACVCVPHPLRNGMLPFPDVDTRNDTLRATIWAHTVFEVRGTNGGDAAHCVKHFALLARPRTGHGRKVRVLGVRLHRRDPIF